MIGLIQKDLLLIKRSMGTTMLILAFLVIVFSASMGASAGMAMNTNRLFDSHPGYVCPRRHSQMGCIRTMYPTG